MTAIWQSQDSGWTLPTPAGFPDERTLHDLVAKDPQLLPLSGSPRLIIIGRAPVPLGKGNSITDVPDELLAALYDAYVEASGF